jgi:uncharacterized protein DUF6898
MPGDPREVYFEFTAIGGSVKVVAIDALTGTEVSVIGPVNAAQSDLERLALQKLRARMVRDASS